LFYRVQEVLNDNNKVRKLPIFKSLREELPLRGMLSCSGCGLKLTGSRSKSSNGNFYFYYHCNYCGKERFPVAQVNGVFENILNDFTFTKESKEIYQLMVKDRLSVDAKDSERKKVKLEKSLEDVMERIEKLQDLFVDGKIEQRQYTETMLRYNDQKRNITDNLNDIKLLNSEYLGWLKNGINLMSDLKSHYAKSGIREKQQIISSIFPEKFVFDGKKCRTTRINDVLRVILQIYSDLCDKKSGQFFKNIELSTLVESPRIELGSKQAIQKISTRLFSV
jgi:site-specific DNA recombinase